MSAFTTWLCLRIWGVTFLLESFCLGETSWIPASSASRSMVRRIVLVAQVAGASAWKKPLLAGLEALLNGLQSFLAHRAILKAANRGYADIKLRERGTKKVHVFTGERMQVDKPKNAPE